MTLAVYSSMTSSFNALGRGQLCPSSFSSAEKASILSSMDVKCSYQDPVIQKIQEFMRGIALCPTSDVTKIFVKPELQLAERLSIAGENLDTESSQCLPLVEFQNAVDLLNDCGCTFKGYQELKGKIDVLTVEYGKAADESRDWKKALTLAQYYRDTRGHRFHFPLTPSVDWLSKAEIYFPRNEGANESILAAMVKTTSRYLGKHISSQVSDFFEKNPFGEYIDLDAFVQKYSSLDFLEFPKGKEVVKALGRSPLLKEMRISRFATYHLDTAEALGAFLRQSESIEKLALGGPNKWVYSYNNWVVRLDRDTIVPIAEALRENQSLQELDLSHTHIGDQGVLKLIEAIEANPKSKIHTINLFDCDMTDRSARKLLEFIRNRKEIKWVNVAYNRIDPKIEQAIDQIHRDRLCEMDPSKEICSAKVGERDPIPSFIDLLAKQTVHSEQCKLDPENEACQKGGGIF